jgi:hypothetical protein
MKSYLNKPFVIQDPQARLREGDDLMTFVMENGQPKLIPNGTEIRVTDARVLRETVYVNAENFGWTAATNLKNRFLNETVGVFAPQDNDQKGANAAWDAGRFLKQITLIQIVGANNQLKYVSQDIADEYLALVNAAAADGVPMPLKSGFRTYPKQAHLYDGYIRRLPNFNKAAKPGFSNHQDGFAYDFAIDAYAGNPRYDWLKRNGPRHGFVRTVSGEPWHWEYRPAIAQTGAFKAPGVAP